MDKFVVDLDRILDDLEAQESQSQPPHLSGHGQQKGIPSQSPSMKGGDILSQIDHQVQIMQHEDSDNLSSGHCDPQSKFTPQIPALTHPEESAHISHQIPAGASSSAIPLTSCLSSSLCSSDFLRSDFVTNASHDFETNDQVILGTVTGACRPFEPTNLSDDKISSSHKVSDVQPLVSLVAGHSGPVVIPDVLEDNQHSCARGGEKNEEAILAEVMKDVEEYEKNHGSASSAEPQVYDDDELNKIMESISDWQKSNRKLSFDQNDDSENEDEYDEDLAELTNGLVSHASSLRPGIEISHKTSAPESPAASSEVTSKSLQNGLCGPDIRVVSFDDCHVDSDEITEDQMEAYLTDVSDVGNEIHFPTHTDPQTSVASFAHPDGVVNSEESELSNEADSNEIQSQIRAIRPNSLDLMSDAAAAQVTDQSMHVLLPDSHQEDNSSVRVGHHRPFWIPDEEAPVCMHCDTRFTVIKRRHHCRACGKVLCAACCNMKAKLPYMEFRETRVCSVCYQLVKSDGPEDSDDSAAPAPDASNSRPYCTSAPVQTSSDAPPLTVFVPVGVLKRPDRPRGEPKQVVFSDGIRPGCDLRSEERSDTTDESSSSASARNATFHRLRSPPVELNSPLHQKHRSKVLRTVVDDAAGPLPAVLNCLTLSAEPTVENLMKQLRETHLTFYLTKNLHVQLKLVRLDCCAKIEVWSFASKGLSTVGQDEIAVILERVDDEMRVPRDVFRLITSIYDSSSKGLVHSELSHILFPEGLFGSKDYCGFVFVRPTSQCLSSVMLPAPPFLLALLIQRIEVPWAKVFPLRLILRLGAEFNTYPCPAISYRHRKSVYYEVGHTILNVLADFRNFHWTIPVVQGVVINRDFVQQPKRTTLLLPRNRYDSVLKILNQNNEHVLAMGANLNLSTDSHFACFQNEEGQYQTFLFSRDGSSAPLCKSEADLEQKSVAASFMVFSGALKTTSGMTAKLSVVEDGVLIQVLPNVIPDLKKALRDMKDYEISIGQVGEEASELVSVKWGPDDTNFNVGVISPIDGRSLQGVPSVRIHNGTDFANKHYLIRWTEVFFLENQDPGRRDAIEPTKLARVISQSFCRALTMHLDQLVAEKLLKIGLRVSLDPEQVGYEVGANQQPIPALFVNELDEALIPVITGNFLSGIDALIVLELFFSIIVK